MENLEEDGRAAPRRRTQKALGIENEGCREINDGSPDIRDNQCLRRERHDRRGQGKPVLQRREGQIVLTQYAG
jgi:hypothetical protein